MIISMIIVIMMVSIVMMIISNLLPYTVPSIVCSFQQIFRIANASEICFNRVIRNDVDNGDSNYVDNGSDGDDGNGDGNNIDNASDGGNDAFFLMQVITSMVIIYNGDNGDGNFVDSCSDGDDGNGDGNDAQNDK